MPVDGCTTWPRVDKRLLAGNWLVFTDHPVSRLCPAWGQVYICMSLMLRLGGCTRWVWSALLARPEWAQNTTRGWKMMSDDSVFLLLVWFSFWGFQNPEMGFLPTLSIQLLAIDIFLSMPSDVEFLAAGNYLELLRYLCWETLCGSGDLE